MKLLIANRGEIAVRIARACREMGIPCIAVYTQHDQEAPHVYLASEAHQITSYLDAEALISLAGHSGADAIHPGYGFLSENADFAQACAAAGLNFVGPSPEAIRSLGNKIAAKQIMRAAGVPTVPGYEGDDLIGGAKGVGYPLLVKAAGGGGGKGMRIVNGPEQLEAEILEARREAKAAFDDDGLLLERYIQHPRHVEVQIIGDKHGNHYHLFERECSIQRRHQKIIEESPSPIMTADLRQRMTDAALAAAKAADYTNAGTVEFLVDGDQFYFLEVNSRLQVEHPVTELVTGLDLVRLQLMVAAGESLTLEPKLSGHAIEVRIYAEDAEHGFAPSIGRLLVWNEPRGPGVRVDSGVHAGTGVSVHYDPMLAKLIVHAPDRPAAIARMQSALRDFQALGVITTIPFLLDVLGHPEFAAGNLHTDFVSQHFGDWHASNLPPNEALLAIAAAEKLGYSKSAALSNRAETSEDYSPWQTMAGWRNT